MRPYQLPAGGLQITVTNTPTAITDLINTAAGTSIEFPADLNYALLQPKNGSILAMTDGNDPDNTTSPKTGIEVFTNDQDEFKGAPLSTLRLQRQGASDVAVNIQIGWTDAHGN